MENNDSSVAKTPQSEPESLQTNEVATLVQVAPDEMKHQRGRVGVPLLLWICGVPFTLVFFIWLFFFRGP